MRFHSSAPGRQKIANRQARPLRNLPILATSKVQWHAAFELAKINSHAQVNRVACFTALSRSHASGWARERRLNAPPTSAPTHTHIVFGSRRLMDTCAPRVRHRPAKSGRVRYRSHFVGRAARRANSGFAIAHLRAAARQLRIRYRSRFAHRHVAEMMGQERGWQNAPLDQQFRAATRKLVPRGCPRVGIECAAAHRVGNPRSTAGRPERARNDS